MSSDGPSPVPGESRDLYKPHLPGEAQTPSVLPDVEPEPAPSGGSGAAGAPPHRAYGRVVGTALIWTLPNIFIGKFMGVVSQFVLALMLTQHDFGVYGIALAIAMFVQTFRDGGVRELLIQQPDRYEELEGSAFWLALVVNIVVAVAFGLAGELVAIGYASTGFLHTRDELSNLVWIMAASIPISTIPAVLSARLRINMRFKGIAVVAILSNLIRNGGQIALAFAGFGAKSIVLPFLASTLFEAVLIYLLVREAPWMRRPETHRWREMFHKSKWVVLSSFATGIANQGYTLTIGLFMPASVVGVYFFAVQIHMQIESMIAYSLMVVMFPVLARLNHDPARQAQAAIRVARGITLLAAPACIGAALIYPHIETIFFGGKWAESFAPLAILALAYPIRGVFVGVPAPLLQAQGRFKDYFMMWAVNGAGLTLIATAGAAVFRTPAGVAACVSVFMIITGVFSTVRVLAGAGVPPVRTVIAMLRNLLVAIVVGAAVYALDLVLAPWIAARVPGHFHMLQREVPIAAFVQTAAAGLLFAAAYAAAVRISAPAHISELLTVVPGPLARPVRRLFRLA